MDEKIVNGLNLPANSHKSKVTPPEKKKAEKVVTGPVMRQKKSLGRKFSETFLNGDVGNVKEYILYDVAIPAAKKAISSMFNGSFKMLSDSVDIMLFGEANRKHITRDRGTSRVSYRAYYGKEEKDDISARQGRGDNYRKSRARHTFDDIILQNKGEGELVLDLMVERLQQYQLVTVADLYDYCDITSTPIDYNYGWKDLRSAEVVRTRDGYYTFNLPIPIVID